MAVTISKTTADTYFSGTLEEDKWEGFSSGQRTNAIADAIRVISRSLGSSIESETVDTDEYYYPDRAVYYQALYMLQTVGITGDGTQTGIKWTGTSSEGNEVETPSPYSVCAEARRWMDWQSGATITIARG